MIKGVRCLAAAALLVGMGASTPLLATHPESPKAGVVKLGYVELEDDLRYANRGAHSGIVLTDLGRPYQGSQVALEDARAIGRVIGVKFSMEKSTAKSGDELVQQISGVDDERRCSLRPCRPPSYGVEGPRTRARRSPNPPLQHLGPG
jgi:hypothetical protein